MWSWWRNLSAFLLEKNAGKIETIKRVWNNYLCTKQQWWCKHGSTYLRVRFSFKSRCWCFEIQWRNPLDFYLEKTIQFCVNSDKMLSTYAWMILTRYNDFTHISSVARWCRYAITATQQTEGPEQFLWAGGILNRRVVLWEYKYLLLVDARVIRYR